MKIQKIYNIKKEIKYCEILWWEKYITLTKEFVIESISNMTANEIYKILLEWTQKVDNKIVDHFISKKKEIKKIKNEIWINSWLWINIYLTTLINNKSVVEKISKELKPYWVAYIEILENWFWEYVFQYLKNIGKKDYWMLFGLDDIFLYDWRETIIIDGHNDNIWNCNISLGHGAKSDRFYIKEKIQEYKKYLNDIWNTNTNLFDLVSYLNWKNYFWQTHKK